MASYQLGVGVANGELTLDRSLFSIPSYGPAQALDLSYSSLEATGNGRFGIGWSSNLTQHLTFESGFVVWHRADGGRVPFGNVAGTWTALAGNFETLTTGSGTSTVTLKDQTKLVFADTAPGRLQRIENRVGKALTLTWGSSAATATDASGRSTTLTVDSVNNRITAVVDSAGRAWGFGYSAAGDLSTVTDPLSAVTTLAYDASHRLTSISRIRTPASGPIGAPSAGGGGATMAASTASIAIKIATAARRPSWLPPPEGAAWVEVRAAWNRPGRKACRQATRNTGNPSHGDPARNARAACLAG